jgi:hypothetical protein
MVGLYCPSTKEDIMEKTLKVKRTKDQLVAAGFVPDEFNEVGMYSYELVHPAGDVCLVVAFATGGAEIHTAPTAEWGTAEYRKQERSPRNLPTIEFTVEEGGAERISEVLALYINLFTSTK